jgi:hypothetical protein
MPVILAIREVEIISWGKNWKDSISTKFWHTAVIKVMHRS